MDRVLKYQKQKLKRERVPEEGGSAGCKISQRLKTAKKLRSGVCGGGVGVLISKTSFRKRGGGGGRYFYVSKYLIKEKG